MITTVYLSLLMRHLRDLHDTPPVLEVCKRGQPQSEKRRRNGNDARKNKELELRRDVVTAAVEEAENRIEEIDAAFCRPGFFEDTDESTIRSLQSERDTLSTDLEKLMSEWEEIESDLERSGD